jgi:transcriptional regulator with XRE-family HTH domain
MSQLILFKKTGIWPSRISYIENGHLPAKEEEKKKLSKALGVEIDWLFPLETKKGANLNEKSCLES